MVLCCGGSSPYRAEWASVPGAGAARRDHPSNRHVAGEAPCAAHQRGGGVLSVRAGARARRGVCVCVCVCARARVSVPFRECPVCTRCTIRTASTSPGWEEALLLEAMGTARQTCRQHCRWGWEYSCWRVKWGLCFCVCV